jgi:hypothetical protein
VIEPQRKLLKMVAKEFVEMPDAGHAGLQYQEDPV